MKKVKKSFTLIEMMMVLGIIAILFGIGTAVFTIATGKSEIAKAKSDVAQLTAAVEMYYDRWGQYPDSKDGGTDINEEFHFGEWLSKVAPIATLNNGWTGKRPMFIKFKEQGFEVSDEDYDAETVTTGVVVSDPWGTPYGYSIDATGAFIVYSVGTYEVDGALAADLTNSGWEFSDASNTYSSEDAQKVGIISSHLK
ncbi:prepilin-type N-terminal cleavage/methylation domain-containing protein [Lentisphaera profundi]|uniref:Prepilin-type N-terminal cleavage/methylation domain-containing protein n=1 Tax=Lentisphaera profundi TaxID=1658616 RepID=A0ABY7VVW5_9BACT|nr:prepilin-type N-terminal cleavage/methylation domain-containing protein [Lentisphaera profundi]WDE98376.1 prepilin-type N-terminal cleavage/methylation domain-containing protein [Lentisphaera profundi]